MTFEKGSALALGFVGAVALGVWIGPHIIPRGATVTDATASASPNEAPAASVDRTAVELRRGPASTRRASTKPRTTATTTTATFSGETPRIVPAAAPALHDRLKPLLNKGANMAVASEDFGDAQQFAAVAHAARNTDVPFMVLKHRVVDEGKTLQDAIHESKPDLNAPVEADRARAEAKADISALEG
jgi:hypothetical protein